MKIAIGSDHAGFVLKKQLIDFLASKGIELQDFGTFSENSMDYPDVAHPVCKEVVSENFDYGVLICGSANGMAITANKYAGIRAALCWNNEISALARQHNNANIVCIPARFISENQAYEILNTFLNTPFEGGRHQARVAKISV
jgi:ribose 5-phosphate isomerase B